MRKIITYSGLQKFVKAIDSFPLSKSKSDFYDVDKIITIRQVKELKEIFGEEEYKEILNLAHIAQEGVNMCKVGDLEKGFLKMKSAKKLAQNLRSEAYLYFHIYYLSCTSFYYFKIKKYETALELAWQEIDEIEKFESIGVPTLHYRRAGGRMLNIIKVLNVSGQKESAINLLLGIFLYALKGENSLIPRANWNQEKIDIIPYARQRYIDILFQQIVEASLDYSTLSDTFFYENVYSKISEFEVSNNNLAIIHNWLFIQKIYSKALYKDFIRQSIDFLKEPTDSTYDILKISLLSKIRLIIQNSDLDNSTIEKCEIDICNYIKNGLFLNSKFKEKVCLM
jgi:hypothetical protein